MALTSWLTASIMLVSFLIIAALCKAFEPNNNDQIKRVGFFLILYLIAVSLFHAAQVFQWSQINLISGNIIYLIGSLTLIELSLTLLFKLIIPRLGYHPPSIISDIIFGFSIIVLLVVTLSNFGVDTTSIAATSAVVTAILAIGLQATLGNIIGGVALQLDKSIRLGDWIQLENGTQGKVQELRWRHTVIETRDWDTLIVPNSFLLAANIIILGKRVGESLQHRMWVHFNVDFRTNPSQVIDIVEAALQAKPGILNVANHPKPNCICLDFSSDNRESYAQYAIRYWLTDIQEDDPTNSLVRKRLYAALQRANIPLAIPAAQLFIDQDDSERRSQKEQKNIQQRLNALNQIDFLTELNQDELIILAKGLQSVLYSKGENIMRQNDKASWLYILTQGTASVWVESGGMNSKVADIKSPTFVGEMGLMTGAARSATIIATSDVYSYRLHKDEFQKIILQRPNIVNKISEILAKRDVETSSIKDKLNEAVQNQKIEQNKTHLLTKISMFFGLD
ncbi:mechanosensitive ion channel family protein [Colwellia echini]|uniref:Mechanosensitive ion channel n=1 Tax=Colwellia echini TaxID=1982103 RepID=A0ABY3MYJ0_9GAMM|nr:mechanosensitive ion channel family protein [Colwellia echini]TYK66283.1 mechanosensitive ion channel [Colwellia echini]